MIGDFGIELVRNKARVGAQVLVTALPILFFTGLLTGCARNHLDHFPVRLASSDIRGSFLGEVDHFKISPFGEVNGSLLKIKRDALGKAFLLTSTLFPADNTPIPHHMLPKVVAFETNDSEIALFELNIYAIYKELPSTKLLQTFVIVSQDNETITFKWAYRLRSISTESSAMLPGVQESLGEGVALVPVYSSFLKRIEFVGNQLELEQLSQIEVKQPVFSPVPSTSKSVRLKMTLSPYQPNSRFTPILAGTKKGFGFFEIPQTRKNEGDIDLYTARWDLSPEAGPITYQIAKNTPVELVSAVEEGVLYWNQVTGREIVRVEKDVDVSSHPSFRKVPIYWIPWNKAAFSVASVQPDPLTGEILSATVFLSSPVGLNGRLQVRSSLGGFHFEANHTAQAAPQGFLFSSLCQLSSSPRQDALRELDLSAANPQTHSQSHSQMILKAARDAVRSTTAHEVGHTLGLSHNFAGSVASELPTAEDHLKKWKEYISDPIHPGAIISSTVMDYFNGVDDLLLGAAIREESLAYDSAVMKWAYGTTDLARENQLEMPPYCSDLEAAKGTILGCAPFDSGRNPLDGYTQQIAQIRKTLALRLLDDILTAAKAPHPADRRSVREAVVMLRPSFVSATLTRVAAQIFKNVSSQSSALMMDRKFDGSNWMNEKLYVRETRDFLSKSLEQVHGLPGILRAGYALDSSMKIETGWLLRQVSELLSQPQFWSGVTWSGIHYELNDRELSDLKTYLPQLAERLEEFYLRDFLLAITGVDPAQFVYPSEDQPHWSRVRVFEGSDQTFAEQLVTDQWQEDLPRLVEQIILDGDGTAVGGTVDGDAIAVPAAKYGLETRLAAARLLNRKIFNKGAWAIETRSRVLEAVRARSLLVARELSQIEQHHRENRHLFGLTIKGMNLTPDLREWVVNELFVYVYLKAIDADAL